MNLNNLNEKEKLEVKQYPNCCPKCFSTNVTPTFDYEHDVINFHCEKCGNDFNSDEFVECGYCHEKIHNSLSFYSDETNKDYCCLDCLNADNE